MRFGLRELIFFFVLLAVPVASFVFVFKPRNAEIERARMEISTKQQRLDTLADMVAKIPDLELAIEEGRQSIELIEQKLPGQQDVEGILEQVWSLAKKDRLVIKSVKSQKPVPAAMYMEQPLKINLEGKFDGFYQFLLDLENLPRITRIHMAKLERAVNPTVPQQTGKKGDKKDPKANNAPPPGTMKAEFTLSIYFQPNAPTTVAAAQ